jgi:hypothetical protein
MYINQNHYEKKKKIDLKLVLFKLKKPILIKIKLYLNKTKKQEVNDGLMIILPYS